MKPNSPKCTASVTTLSCLTASISRSTSAANNIALGDRHFGVGCDKFCWLRPASQPGVDFHRIFNNDGGEVEQCATARAVSPVSSTPRADRQTRNPRRNRWGIIGPRLEDNGEVTVDMGAPFLKPAEVPLIADAQAAVYPFDIDGKTYEITAISMWATHAITVTMVDCFPVGAVGAAIEVHPRFPQKVNAGFMQIVDRSHIRLRVFERGAGETLSSACAAVVAGILRSLLDGTVRAQYPWR